MTSPLLPTSPHASPAPVGDAFACVQRAVLVVWPTIADATAGPTAAERNRMLDECGSDHRPLLDLALDLGRTVRPALHEVSGTVRTVSAWQALRAAQVHRIVATRFLQPEVARWAVEVWGRVVGVAVVEAPRSVEGGTAEATKAEARTAVGRTAGIAGTAGGASRATPSRVPASKLGVPAAQVPAALKAVPSWAGGPVSFGVGKTPKASTLAAMAARGRVVVQHGSTGPVGPMWQPAERRAAIVFAVLLVLCGGSMWVALERRRDGDAAALALPRADDIGRDTVSTPPTAAAPSVAAGNPAVSDPNATANAAAIGYNLVPLPPARGAAVNTSSGAADATNVRARGVAGRYRLVQQVRAVNGTENCNAVAQALGAGRVTEEVIVHVPGAREFTIASRQVKGTLTSDGWFEAEPSSGSMNNVTWHFRMSGRFTADGFRGESEMLTDAIIRWGRQQTCVVTADLVATRVSSNAS